MRELGCLIFIIGGFFAILIWNAAVAPGEDVPPPLEWIAKHFRK